MPLLNIELQSPASPALGAASLHDPDEPPRKGWLTYAPLAVAVLFILAPHPSYLVMLVSFYIRTRHAPVRFWTHLLAVYAITFLALTSLMVCVVRDPGPVAPEKSKASVKGRSRERQSPWQGGDLRDDAEDSQVTTALLRSAGEDGGEGEGEDENGDDHDHAVGPDELTFKGRWCRRCCQPRPERAHHCSTCGRCVLKMDHHCPWLGGNCVGHRTYPAFLHFIFSGTMLAAYITCIALVVVVHLVSDPFSIVSPSSDPHVSPLHALFLVLIGAVFTLTLGSFLIYHLYLVSTNQTTLEHMSPYLVLRHLPPPEPQLQSPASPNRASSAFPSYATQIPQPKRHPPPPPSPHARPKIATSLAEPPTPPESPLFPSSPPHQDPTCQTTPIPLHPTSRPTPVPPYLNPRADLDPRRVPPPFRTTLPYLPPEEHELSSAQRRLVKHTHGQLRLYDVGFRKNWRQVFGGGRRGWRGWVSLIFSGGAPKGDGRTWERRRGAGAGLDRLARGLEDIRKQETRNV